MPPKGYSPQIAGKVTSKNAEPYYSNEDIAVLNDIVILAQELLPTEPLATNALFSAYYTVLAKFRVNPDHDNRYARILFKIGGLRGSGTLYEKFEEVLSRMGIEIEFIQEDEERSAPLEDSTSNPTAPALRTPVFDGNEEVRGRQRRNSESSAWDLGIHLQPHLRKRNNSLSSAPKYEAKIPNIHHTAEDQSHMQDSELVAPAKQDYQKELLDQNIGTWLASGSAMVPIRRDNSVSTHRSLRIRRGSLYLTKGQPAIGPSVPTSDDYQPASETTAATSRFDETTSAQSQQNRHDILESESLMEIKASLVFSHNLALFAKSIIKRWKDRTRQVCERNIDLDFIAAAHDRSALIHSALDTWRLRSLEKNQIAETERFFTQLEKRATRARELYLLHVAFTHWSTCAFEEVQRTALARKHIIRTKIFNAWREFTAVNELKIRRHIVRKFFRFWMQRHQLVVSEDTAAVQKYMGDLVKNSYQAWVQKLLTMKAFSWWAERTKQQKIFHWIVVSHKIWKTDHTAEAVRYDQLLGYAFRAWRTKVAETSSKNVQASVHYDNTLRRNALNKWTLETGVIPATHAVQNDIAFRQLRGAFSTWLHRTRQEQRASALDRMKILQEALTNWRHKARSRMVNHKTDDRVLLHAMYKWILTARTIMTCRTRAKTRLGGAMQLWTANLQASKDVRWDQETVAQASLVRKTQNHALRHWYLSMGSLQRLEVSAIQFNASRLLQTVLLQWSIQAQHLQKLQRWSQDAEFYFVASRALHKWRSSTESSRRDKRKVAYAQVRRMTNMKLAKSAFLIWHRQTEDKHHLNNRVLETIQNRHATIELVILDRWRSRTEEVTELDIISRDHVFEKHFSVWKNRSLALQALHREATITYEERRESKALKKWSLATLQLRAQTNYAADIREKNAKRTFRRIFTYWQQKVAIRRPLIGVSSELESTTKVEPWSELGEELRIDELAKDLNQLNPSASVPGYLSTPSKRSERVMAAAARYSTTPRAPLSTPFERHLRAQWSETYVPSFRSTGLGRSTLGKEGFADLPKRSTSKDGYGQRR